MSPWFICQNQKINMGKALFTKKQTLFILYYISFWFQNVIFCKYEGIWFIIFNIIFQGLSWGGWGISSVQFSRLVVSDSLRPHESQHARPPCPSPTLRVHSDSRPSSRWCHPASSSSVVPFSSCPNPCSGHIFLLWEHAQEKVLKWETYTSELLCWQTRGKKPGW